LPFEPEPAAVALFPAFAAAAAEAAVVVAEGEAETAIEEGERVAFGFLESGCEYLKGEDFLVEPRPEAVAKKRARTANDAIPVVVVVVVATLPSPSVDGMNAWTLIMFLVLIVERMDEWKKGALSHSVILIDLI